MAGTKYRTSQPTIILQPPFERKNAIGALVNFFITHVRWKVTGNFDEPLLRYNAELPQDVIAALNVFKKVCVEIRDSSCRNTTY